jgi:hypothetical protein
MIVLGIEMPPSPLYMFYLVEGRKESGMSVSRGTLMIGKLMMWQLFFHLIQSKSLTHEEDDKFKGRLKKNGAFDIRSFYLAICGNLGQVLPWKSIWGVKAPRSVAFFVWTAAWGKILTCENLRQ